ncbi:hypothetical protein [Xanthomonas arboricola]|uniref:hypothetical protein n=1 Tax=Xanthomonas arboricola TaxID=56448 RepID=UPI0018749E49|nr:hypothetical protein [Xanthomonas arboricola]
MGVSGWTKRCRSVRPSRQQSNPRAARHRAMQRYRRAAFKQPRKPTTANGLSGPQASVMQLHRDEPKNQHSNDQPTLLP